MINWLLVTGVIWMCLVAAVIFLALCRISAAMHDQKLIRAGLDTAHPLHVRFRQLIQTEDRVGITLTVIAFICSIILAFMLADQVLRNTIHKLIFAFFA
jgi:hypothetical protein